jgi:hypothetical protein
VGERDAGQSIPTIAAPSQKLLGRFWSISLESLLPPHRVRAGHEPVGIRGADSATYDIPEPATFGLILAGLLVAWWLKRKRS